MRGGSTLNLESFLIVSAFKGVNFQKRLFTPPLGDILGPFNWYQSICSHLKLHRRKKRMLTPIELEPALLQNDGLNFLPWSIHVVNAFRDISPLVEHIVDASIPLHIVDWSNYKNLSKEEEICMQLNAQAINVILSTLTVEVQDEAIFNGQPPSESAHLIWTRLVELYGKSKCDDALDDTTKKPHKTSRAPSQSKKCKQRMTCCLLAHTRRVRYAYRMCPVCPRQ